MKNYIILLSLFVCGSALANPQERCQELIRDQVQEVAAAKGFETPGYELSEAEPFSPVDVPCGGRTCNSMWSSPDAFTIHSSVFITDDGYIAGSGLIAFVTMDETSCTIDDLDISFGYFNP